MRVEKARGIFWGLGGNFKAYQERLVTSCGKGTFPLRGLNRRSLGLGILKVQILLHPCVSTLACWHAGTLTATWEC